MGAELEAERAAALSDQPDERELERLEKQAKRRHERTRLRVSLIAIGSMLALVAIITAIPAGLEALATAKRGDEAKAAVTDYLTAMSAGDGARASSYVPNAETEQSKWQLANEMLANAVERINVEQVGTPDAESPSDTVVDVPATVSLAGTRYDLIISMALEKDRWQLFQATDQLSGAINIASDADDYLTIGGVRTELADSEARDETLWAPAHEVFVHAGVYPIERPESVWNDPAAEPSTVTLLPGLLNIDRYESLPDYLTVTVTSTPNAKFTEAVTASLDEEHRACEELAGTKPYTCQLWSYNDNFDVASSAKLLEQPTLKITSLHSAELSGGTVRITKPDGATSTVAIYDTTMLVEIVRTDDGKPKIGLVWGPAKAS